MNVKVEQEVDERLKAAQEEFRGKVEAARLAVEENGEDEQATQLRLEMLKKEIMAEKAQ